MVLSIKFFPSVVPFFKNMIRNQLSQKSEIALHKILLIAVLPAPAALHFLSIFSIKRIAHQFCEKDKLKVMAQRKNRNALKEGEIFFGF